MSNRSDGFKIRDKRSIKGEYEKACDDQKTEEQVTSANFDDDFPAPDFKTFISSLSANAMIHLGLIKEPSQNRVIKNLSMARYTIDIIGMLKEKTMGNLTKDEQEFIDNILYDLRLKFINECNKK